MHLQGQAERQGAERDAFDEQVGKPLDHGQGVVKATRMHSYAQP